MSASRSRRSLEGPPRRPLVLLVLGALAGAGLAAAGLILPSRRAALPAGAVALVNGEPIRADDCERMVQGLANDRREAITAADRGLWRGKIGACAPI